jgi:hypothetical protein
MYRGDQLFLVKTCNEIGYKLHLHLKRAVYNPVNLATTSATIFSLEDYPHLGFDRFDPAKVAHGQ